MSTLDVEVRFERGAMIVAVAGELDVASAPELQRQVDDAAPATGSTTVFDLSQVTFIDSAGLALLLRIDRALAPSGRYLAIAAPPGQVSRVLAQTGLSEHFPIRESVTAAIDAVA